ncbi:MFS transporter [Micropruina sp.]|uniref:MFS transporter n=1 Tax=Micropruina sp. TaxID=2737536 RepID=UPI00261B9DF6|nr:MFS transporter [Micropruina sp.]
MTANADATEPLWNWDFRKWFAGRTISTLGTEATAIAIPVLIFQQTGSPALTGLVSAVIVLPYLVFGLIAGGVADRMNRRGLMVASDLVGAMALVSIPIAHLAGLHSTVHILVVTFVVWTAFVWFDAASFGALIAVVGKSKLAAANSALWSSATVVGIVVPALAGIVIALWGPEVILMADALSAVASALLIMRIRTDLRPTAVVDGSSEKLWRSIREGLRFIWASTTLRLATLGMAALTFAGGLAMGLLVVFFARALDAPQGALGVFFAAAAVGALLASLTLTRLRRRFGPGRLMVLAFLGFVPLLVLFAFVPAWVASLVIWTAWNFLRTLATINNITIRQEETPPELQGRVNMTGRMIALSGTPAGALVGGVLVEFVPIQVVFAMAAVPVLAVSLVFLRSPLWTRSTDGDIGQ